MDGCVRLAKKTGRIFFWAYTYRRLVLKIICLKLEVKNGEKIVYEYEIKFNTVKIKDIELPDISEYEIVH